MPHRDRTPPQRAVIHLDRLRDNLTAARRLLAPGVRVWGVVKADGYGHGAAAVARTLERAGADGLVVAGTGEGMALRRAGIRLPILALDPPMDDEATDLVQSGLTATVTSLAEALPLSAAARALNRRVPVHVRIDTGLAGLGAAPDDAVELLTRLRLLDGLRVEGLFTHLASPYSGSPADIAAELALFDRVVTEATAHGLRPPLVHALSSPGVMRAPQATYDMVRLGSLLYGIHMVETGPDPFVPVMEVTARVVRVMDLPPGARLGYRAGAAATSPMRAALVAFGFSDGAFLHAYHDGVILLRGRRVPLVGDPFMSALLADVSTLPEVEAGDEAILIGCQGGDILTVEEVASACGLRPSAILMLGPRVAREYSAVPTPVAAPLAIPAE